MVQWLVIGISGVTCGGKTTLAHKLRDYFVNQTVEYPQLWDTPYTINEVRLISQDDYFLPVNDPRHKWVEPLNAINFELMTSLDMKQMLSDIEWTLKGRSGSTNPIEAIDYSTDMTLYGGASFDHISAQSQLYNGNFVAPHLQMSTHAGAGASTMHHMTAKPTQLHKHMHYQHMQHSNMGSHLHNNAQHIMRINSHMLTQLADNRINILIIEGFMIFNQPELLTLCNIKFHFHLPYEKCFERRRNRTYDPPDVVGYFEMCVWPHYEKNFMEFRERKDILFLNGEIGKEKIFRFALQRILQYFDDRCDVACPPPHKLLGIPSCGNGNIAHASLHVSPMEQQ